MVIDRDISSSRDIGQGRDSDAHHSESCHTLLIKSLLIYAAVWDKDQSDTKSLENCWSFILWRLVTMGKPGVHCTLSMRASYTAACTARVKAALRARVVGSATLPSACAPGSQDRSSPSNRPCCWHMNFFPGSRYLFPKATQCRLMARTETSTSLPTECYGRGLQFCMWCKVLAAELAFMYRTVAQCSGHWYLSSLYLRRHDEG